MHISVCFDSRNVELLLYSVLLVELSQLSRDFIQCKRITIVSLCYSNNISPIKKKKMLKILVFAYTSRANKALRGLSETCPRFEIFRSAERLHEYLIFFRKPITL